MPYRKISGPEKVCRSPEHEPPMHMVLEAGATYEWTCPTCGHTVIVHGPDIYWNVPKPLWDKPRQNGPIVYLCMGDSRRGGA
jgi:hypothetical protein